jgi:hypothetical protein
MFKCEEHSMNDRGYEECANRHHILDKANGRIHKKCSREAATMYPYPSSKIIYKADDPSEKYILSEEDFFSSERHALKQKCYEENEIQDYSVNSKAYQEILKNRQ